MPPNSCGPWENDIFDNDGYIASSDCSVRKWEGISYQTVQHSENGKGNIRRYRETLFTMSTPFIGKITNNAHEDFSSLRDKWIAILGNGSPIGQKTPWNKGSVLFIDVLNGDVLNWINVPNNGQVVSPVVVPSSDSCEDPHLVEKWLFCQ